MKNNLEKKPWWNYLSHDLRELLTESYILLKKVKKWNQVFHDYSFVVFPAAKAYEGFLKTLFLEMGFINKNDYYGKRFRIGKALNPSLDPEIREKESVYDRIVEYCGGKSLSDELWDTWKRCRNLLFHWFPKEKNAIDYGEAKERFAKVINAIDMAYGECELPNDKETKKV